MTDGDTLHMVEIPIDRRAFFAWAQNRNYLVRRRDLDGPNRLTMAGTAGGGRAAAPSRPTAVLKQLEAYHALVTELFWPDVSCYRFVGMMQEQKEARLLLYTPQPPDEMRDRVQIFASPLQLGCLDLDGMESKAMQQRFWRPGMRMGFEVTVRPMMRPKGRRRGEVDVYRIAQRKSSRWHLSREDAYRAWLADEMGRRGGVTVEKSEVSQYRIYPDRNDGIESDGPLRPGPRVVMQGILAIGCPESFQTMLRRGIGRYRTYGYGLVQLRQPMLKDH